jgi:DNA repair exonuclease SbcCD ATPase subunit
MAENENNIPVKELEDGSAQVAYELEADPLENVEVEDEEGGKKKKKKEKDDLEASDDHDDESEDRDEEQNEGETDEEREAIREARREERRLKKELKKQRDLSAQNKIKTLERHNEELARRLAAVESSAASFQFAQVDKAIEDEATRVEYAKMKLVQAAQANDANAQVEYLEQLQDAKNKLAQIQAYKKQQLEETKRPKQNVPNEISTEVQKNATKWLKNNKWYDPNARDTDSKIAKVIDQDLAAEGWDPSDPEYWEELDSRLSARLPHRYAAKSNSPIKRAGPTASSRTANPAGKAATTITLSRERVQAIKDAGKWDDPVARSKAIKAYAEYDRQNRKG